MATVVAVVVVGTHTDGHRGVLRHAIGEVQLSAVDILLTLHVGVEGIHIGHDAFLEQQGCNGHVEHGHTLFILDEATAAYDTNHGRYSPVVMLVCSKQGGHDGCRCLAFVFLVEVLPQKTGNCRLYITVLPRFLEVERHLETVVSPGQAGGVGVGGVNLRRGAPGHHTVEGDVVIRVGHKATGIGCQLTGDDSHQCHCLLGHFLFFIR